MHILLTKRSFHYGIAGIFLICAILLLVAATRHRTPEYVTTAVERGTVTDLVSVSGFVEAENTAELAFPVTGIVRSVLVREGDTVTTDERLITLEQTALAAERRDAESTLISVQADRDELLAGPRSEERAVTATEVTIAKTNLANTIAEETEKVANARATLLSSSLEAVATNVAESATAPTVSGTYTCEAEGTYRLEVYRSSTDSGYSYNLSGLENGTYSMPMLQPGTLGSCGLRVQFTDGDKYGNSVWEIAIPNTSGNSYITNKNAYTLAQEQAETKISAAEQSLELALKQQSLANATPRDEALKRANAAVMQAESRLARIDAELSDRVLTAPFAGTITSLDVLPGETVTTAPVVTLLADDVFEVTARIPEIDIAKIAVGQPARVTFDANTDEPQPGKIRLISENATEIDGVAYFEAKITLDTPPTWLRSGLNADVDIITAEMSDVLKLPKRFITTTDTESTVQLLTGETTVTTTPIDIQFTGNDGFVAITGINEGDIVVAP